jgi:hypothetical protein
LQNPGQQPSGKLTVTIQLQKELPFHWTMLAGPDVCFVRHDCVLADQLIHKLKFGRTRYFCVTIADRKKQLIHLTLNEVINYNFFKNA